MSIADKISQLQTAKTNIRNAILAKSGTCAAENGFDDFSTDIASIPSGSGGGTWTRPAEWPQYEDSMLEDTEVLYLTSDSSLSFDHSFRFYVIGNVIIKRGNVVNGEFVIEEGYIPISFSNGWYTETMPESQRYYSYQITPAPGSHITGTSLSLHDIILERFANLPYCSNYCINNYGQDTSASSIFIESDTLWNFKPTSNASLNATWRDAICLKKLVLKNSDVTSCRYSRRTFYNCCALKELDLSDWELTSNNFSEMFYNCFELNTLILGTFTATSSSSVKNMFNNCHADTLDCRNFDFSEAINLSYLFSGCHASTININGIDTHNCTDMSNMFYNCLRLKYIIGINDINTESVLNMSSMFLCPSLSSIDISNFDFSSVTNIYGMFYQNADLNVKQEIIFPQNSICSNITYTDRIFQNGGWNTSFEKFTNFISIPISFSLRYCNNLTKQSLLYVLNALPTVQTPQTCTLGSTNLAKLTDEEKEIATNKGWTLA